MDIEQLYLRRRQLLWSQWRVHMADLWNKKTGDIKNLSKYVAEIGSINKICLKLKFRQLLINNMIE